MDELMRLAGLHASGALTDVEFHAVKAKLLGTSTG
jgi:Short C-terminal domain